MNTSKRWTRLYEPFRRGKCIIGPIPNVEPYKWTCLEYDTENEAIDALCRALITYHLGINSQWQKENNISQWALND